MLVPTLTGREACAGNNTSHESGASSKKRCEQSEHNDVEFH